MNTMKVHDGVLQLYVNGDRVTIHRLRIEMEKSTQRTHSNMYTNNNVSSQYVNDHRPPLLWTVYYFITFLYDCGDNMFPLVCGARALAHINEIY